MQSLREKKLKESLHPLDEVDKVTEEFRGTFATHLRTPFKWAN
jgi:ATP-dependent Lon protease